MVTDVQFHTAYSLRVSCKIERQEPYIPEGFWLFVHSDPVLAIVLVGAGDSNGDIPVPIDVEIRHPFIIRDEIKRRNKIGLT